MVRVAAIADVKAIDALRRRSQEAVGFVPLSKYEWQIGHQAECLLVGLENNDMVGFIYWTPGIPVAAIQQLVVREDARRRERGTSLVEAAIAHMEHDQRRYGVTCRCRIDLDAVDFWKALAFEPVRMEVSGKRGDCIRFYRALHPALLPLGLYLPTTTAGKSARLGFRFQKPATPPVPIESGHGREAQEA